MPTDKSPVDSEPVSEDAADPESPAAADPGTNRSHRAPDDKTDLNLQDDKNHVPRSPYTAGNQ